MVRARYKNTKEDFAYFTRYTEFFANGKFAKILCFLVAALALIVVALFTGQGVFLVCAAIFAGFGLLLLALSLGAVSKRVSAMLREAKEFYAVENVYVFSENGFAVENKVKGRIKTKEVPYANILRAVEVKKFFFLYVNRTLAFIVSKAGIEEGSAEELSKTLFAALGKKRCKLKKGREKHAER